MNKKLLKGAVALFASIFMAVSCSAGDKTGGDTKPSVSKSDVETFLKRLDGATELTVAGETILGSGNTFAVKLVVNTKTVEDVKGLIAQKLTAANNLQAVSANDIIDNRLEVDADNKAVTYTITLKPASGYNIGGFGTVKVVVTPDGSNKWKKIDLNEAAFQNAIKEALGTTVGDFIVGEPVATGDANKVTITSTHSSSGAGRLDTVKGALENKYDNVKTVLEGLGISTTAKSLTTGNATTKLTGTLSSCKLSGLYNITVSSFSSTLSSIEIVLVASGGNWS